MSFTGSSSTSFDDSDSDEILLQSSNDDTRNNSADIQEEDEEVVLENSPLYNYLKEEGFDDFETVAMVSERPPDTRPVTSSPKQSFFSRICGQVVFHDCDIVQDAVSTETSVAAVRLILDSGILTSQDKLSFTDYVSTDPSSTVAPLNMSQYVAMQSAKLLASTTGASFLASEYASGVLAAWPLPVYPLQCLQLLAVSFMLCYSGFSLWKLAYLVMLRRKADHSTDGLTKFVAEAKSTKNTVKKSFRFLYELDLSSKGFLLLPLCSSVVRETGRPSTTCKPLRLKLANTCQELFMLYRSTSRYLLSEFDSGLDATLFTCNIPLECLQEQTGLFAKTTDNELLCSLSKIKVLQSLYLELQSQFFLLVMLHIRSGKSCCKDLLKGFQETILCLELEDKLDSSSEPLSEDGVNESLEAINSKLTMCQDVVGYTRGIVSRNNKTVFKCQKTPPGESATEPTPDERYLPLAEDFDVEDQIFEAVVRCDEKTVGNDGDFDDDDDVTAVERKRTREEEMRMMRELKVVLKVKEEEWREREEKAGGIRLSEEEANEYRIGAIPADERNTVASEHSLESIRPLCDQIVSESTRIHEGITPDASHGDSECNDSVDVYFEADPDEDDETNAVRASIVTLPTECKPRESQPVDVSGTSVKFQGFGFSSELSKAAAEYSRLKQAAGSEETFGFIDGER